MVKQNEANWITRDYLCKFRDKANEADAGVLSRDHKQKLFRKNSLKPIHQFISTKQQLLQACLREHEIAQLFVTGLLSCVGDLKEFPFQTARKQAD